MSFCLIYAWRDSSWIFCVKRVYGFCFKELTFFSQKSFALCKKSAERDKMLMHLAVKSPAKTKITGDRIDLSPVIYAWRDCLDLFALNVSTCFASKNLRSFRKSTPHSAHRSLEHAGSSFLARQIASQNKN